MNADISSRLQAGFALLQQGRAQEALAAGRSCAADSPRTAAAHHLLALAAKALGSEDVADAAFRQAVALAPNDARILVDAGNWHKKRGDTEKALSAYERATAAAPDFALAWTNLGITANAAGASARAVEALERAVALEPGSALAWQALGGAYRTAGDPSRAEGAYRKAAELAPGNAANLVGLAVALRFQGRPAHSLPYLHRARELGFAGPELDDLEAACRLDLGEFKAARDQARSLLQRRPDYVPTLTLLANLLWEHGGLLEPGEDPLIDFRNAAERFPDNRKLQLEYLGVLLQTKQQQAALEHIEKLKNRPGAPNLAIFEANALAGLGRSDEAHVLYEQVYAAEGARSMPFINAFVSHLIRTGRIELAARRAEEATRVHPDSQEAWAYLSTAWRLLNDPREYWLCDYDRLISFVEVEPPKQFADQSAFITALIDTLEPMHQANREPMQQSLRGGSQTPGRLFGRDDPIIEAAHTAFIRAAEGAVARLPDDPTHPFLKHKKRSVREIGSWSVKLWTSGKHVNHFHPLGWMSSAFYISLPPSVARPGDNRQSGWLQFGAPTELLNIDMAPRHVIQPKVGWLALFPSYMWHGTIPFEDAEPRMTIAFDMQPLD